eukprot:TRINITY_DN28671_c0_g1_i1.p1 TRINITY_DN28671_c0_g1~~TRINITY_DN28671_c0_g1_i1.p1  ORF type:complete len:248 (+),score=36.34 TRINITY_DN28671_c0_g1_i1:60-746(+)
MCIRDRLDIVEESTGTACLITTSTSEKYFSTGLDLPYFNSLPTALDAQNFLQEFGRLMGRLLVFPIPTIAAVNGHAIAGGMGLAMTHDWRVMREDQGFLSMNEINIKMNIPAAMEALIACKLTPRVHSEVCLTGKMYTGKEAYKLGMVDRLASKENVLKEALAIAAEMLPKSEVREAYGGIKKVMYRRVHDICMNRQLDDTTVRLLKIRFPAKPKLQVTPFCTYLITS